MIVCFLQFLKYLQVATIVAFYKANGSLSLLVIPNLLNPSSNCVNFLFFKTEYKLILHAICLG